LKSSPLMQATGMIKSEHLEVEAGIESRLEILGSAYARLSVTVLWTRPGGRISAIEVSVRDFHRLTAPTPGRANAESLW
jgi:hypothetical protein